MILRTLLKMKNNFGHDLHAIFTLFEGLLPLVCSVMKLKLKAL